MRKIGVRKPGLTAMVVLAIGVSGLIAIVIGAVIMEAEDRNSWVSAALIGIGLFVAIMGLPFSAVFFIGRGVYRRVARGEGATARWTLTPDELAAFRTGDARRSAFGPDYLSDYTAPATCPPGGLHVIFVPNGVMIGDVYFGLSNTGLVRFSGLQMLQHDLLAIEFRILYTSVRGATVQRYLTESVLLRVPVARNATEDAARVLTHFEKVLRREIIVDPGFWPLRIKIGLWSAAICGLISATGYMNWSPATSLENPVPEIMMGGGAICAIAGLLLAAGAWILSRRQRGR
jgi:hypothetical protein